MAIDTLNADAQPAWVKPQNRTAPTAPTWGNDDVSDTGTVEMSFWDFVDIVNPLQHVPVINTIYRELTGD